MCQDGGRTQEGPDKGAAVCGPVCREKYMPSVEQSLGKFTGAKRFSKLDANMGFWQIPLTKESAKYTTFITSFGRFHFNRLLFGITNISSAGWQRLLRGLKL